MNCCQRISASSSSSLTAVVKSLILSSRPSRSLGRIRIRRPIDAIMTTNTARSASTSTFTSSQSDKSVGTDASKTHSVHYERHTAKSYEQAYFYEPGQYMEYLVGKTRDALGWTTTTTTANTNNNCSSIVLLDIGGGTGNFAQALIDKQNQDQHHQLQGSPSRINVHVRIRVIDPFLEPTMSSALQSKSASVAANSDLSFIKASAEDFMVPIDDDDDNNNNNNDDDDDDDDAEGEHDDERATSQIGQNKSSWRKRGGYHQILMKEVVHHLRAEDRVHIFRGMYDGLSSVIPSRGLDGGEDTSDSSSMLLPSILIITRPQVDIDYPLWDKAREVWKDNQPSVDEIEHDLQKAGFRRVSSTVEAYPCSIKLHRWQDMILTRFWSTFSHFDDDELEFNARTYIPDVYKDRVDDDGDIHFEDRLVFVRAFK